ncbi:ribonucleoside-triphosphate reductase [Patescibacteria group bacterium]|nr:ribonucleoside-triphosphate reductase [Patescibacteria group bacterium]
MVSEAALNGNGLFKVVSGEIKKVRKRNGRLVDFDVTKIVNAAYRALLATGEGGEEDAVNIAKKVYLELLKGVSLQENFTPGVEEIQDLVERHLIFADYAQTAKAYILYRKEHEDLREAGQEIPREVKDLALESSKHFKNSLAEFVYLRTYSRWRDDLGRREFWVETVDRFMDFMKENLGKKLSTKNFNEVREGILNQEIIPSMRLLWSAGTAARNNQVAAYNCSFISISDLLDFPEIMYISMCGTGVGYSVEEKSIERLPIIEVQTGKKLKTHVVGDSKEGWANAFYKGLRAWYRGRDIDFDYSKVRPKGARLKTMGGRASGSEPLMDLMGFAKEKILARQGKRLSTLDVHDIACKIGEIVVAGGVRRSAMISLSDLDDIDMRDAKRGQFWTNEPQRSMANNSAVYEEKPSATDFMKEWLSLAQSGTGERGIFNRGFLLDQAPERRREKLEKYVSYAGTNPCGEILLRSKQFCNLTAIVIRPKDTKKTLLRKIQLATLLGTYQASLTDFPYLSSEWKKNCEEEALLGVSFTGYYDNPLVRKTSMLQKLRDEAVKTNKHFAKKFGINPSTCVTCVKPSGNSSQLLDTSSGMHPRFSKYYVRRVRINATDPLLKMLNDQGVPTHPEVGQDPEKATSFVLEFPIKSPEDAILKDDVSAIELLEEWKKIKVNFTEHNPSATIYVGDDEWLEVANWVYENWEIVGGLTFLPRTDHVYQLAPYEEIDRKTYDALSKRVANIDFSKLMLYESSDNTEGAKEFACIGIECEI